MKNTFKYNYSISILKKQDILLNIFKEYDFSSKYSTKPSNRSINCISAITIIVYWRRVCQYIGEILF